MAFNESSNQLEKSEGQKPNPEAKKIASIKDFDDFYKDTEKKIVEIVGPEEAKKEGPMNALLQLLLSRIDALKEKYKDAVGEHQEEIDALKMEVQKQISRFVNKRELQKLLGRAEPPEDVPPGGTQEYKFMPNGAKEFVTIKVNDTFQITSITTEGHTVRLNTPVEIRDFKLIEGRIRRVWERIADMDPPISPETEVVAEDMNRFKFKHEGTEYKVISDGMDGVALFKVNEGKATGEGVTTLLDEQGQQVIETTTKNGFTLDMFTKSGGAMASKRFDGGLCVEENYTQNFGGTRIERSYDAQGNIKIRKYLPEQSDPGKKTLNEESTRKTNGDLIESRILDHGKVLVLVNGGPPRSSMYFSASSEKPLFRVEQGTDKPLTFFGENGQQVSDYMSERKKNPTLTPQGYIALLSNVIRTPEQWQAFTEHFMEYVWDSPDPNNPFLPGSEDKHKDYWQTPEETVAREKDGRTLGDCDDYAFLAQALLAAQGKKAFVVGVPKHALCAWIEKRPDGRYDAISICTFGYDKNGNVNGKTNTQKEAGYATPEAALNAIFEKYNKPGRGVTEAINYQIQNGYVEVVSIPEQGEKHSEMVRVEDLVVNP